jgi:hypothetical protein
MNPEDEYEYNITDINMHSFNNKADKGDDDFNDWLANDAPLVSNSTITAIDNSYYTNDTITLTTGSDVYYGDRKKMNDLKYSMPVDLIYKWFPNQTQDDFDDEIPF